MRCLNPFQKYLMNEHKDLKMNKIRMGDIVYHSLKRRMNEIEIEIKKLKRLEDELKELESLVYSSKNYDEEKHLLTFK